MAGAAAVNDKIDDRNRPPQGNGDALAPGEAACQQRGKEAKYKIK